ncbi:hypothetical protein BDQ17DRAFT_1344028 [Cyathus striatus]|nr:hypothetical protein BDQ17DRAFT_1344028 [Cyathus striatus]
MSAYGAISRPSAGRALPSSLWSSAKSSRGYITIHHISLATASKHEGLIDYLHLVFSQVVEDGMTYPQEGDMTRDTFEAYFFGADVFVGIIGGKDMDDITETEIELDIHSSKDQRTWEDSVAGFYYVKPNYPGRSSHICNAGFVVPPKHRGSGYGSTLARSYVYYAPKLGYQASVFNLVYVNNIASVRIWERLGFTKAGRIPRAGRLIKADGNEEEYVDAWVFYKSFMKDSKNSETQG